jgi:hypothetical protein
MDHTARKLGPDRKFIFRIVQVHANSAQPVLFFFEPVKFFFEVRNEPLI